VIGDALFSVIVLVMIVVSVVPAPFFKRTLLRIAAARNSDTPVTPDRTPPA